MNRMILNIHKVMMSIHVMMRCVKLKMKGGRLAKSGDALCAEDALAFQPAECVVCGARFVPPLNGFQVIEFHTMYHNGCIFIYGFYTKTESSLHVHRRVKTAFVAHIMDQSAVDIELNPVAHFYDINQMTAALKTGIPIRV